jgi:hypothetical protein
VLLELLGGGYPGAGERVVEVAGHTAGGPDAEFFGEELTGAFRLETEGVTAEVDRGVGGVYTSFLLAIDQ